MPPTRNITGLRWALDTSTIGNPDLKSLTRLFDLGWIYLETPDTVAFELSFAKNEVKREELQSERNQFPMPLGPHFFGHSALDYSVLGTEEDKVRIDEIHQSIWNRSFSEDISIAADFSNARHRARDSMIVSTSVRYAFDTLVTEDSDLLNASGRLQGKFSIRTINLKSAYTQAIAEIESVRRKALIITDSIWYKNLPDWP